MDDMQPKFAQIDSLDDTAEQKCQETDTTDWDALDRVDQQIAQIANIVDAGSWKPGWKPNTSPLHQRLRKKMANLEAERLRILGVDPTLFPSLHGRRTDSEQQARDEQGVPRG